MDSVIPILLILGALLAGAMSPGPSFVVVANIALGTSRNDGVAASIGMCAGSVILSILALMGLHAVLVNVPSLYIALKVFGGLYLIYLAIKLWRGANKPFDVNPAVLSDNKSLSKSFFIALFTQISNPKRRLFMVEYLPHYSRKKFQLVTSISFHRLFSLLKRVGIYSSH